MKNLEIQLGLNTIKHLEEKSQYNCNYYELEPYGDWCVFFNGNNIIEEICHEEDDFYTYSLGHFDGEEFVSVLQWDGEYGETIFDWRKGDDPCLHLKKQDEQLIKAKEIIKEMLSILPKENIEGVYEITEHAEQFLNFEVEK